MNLSAVRSPWTNIRCLQWTQPRPPEVTEASLATAPSPLHQTAAFVAPPAGTPLALHLAEETTVPAALAALSGSGSSSGPANIDIPLRGLLQQAAAAAQPAAGYSAGGLALGALTQARAAGCVHSAALGQGGLSQFPQAHLDGQSGQAVMGSRADTANFKAMQR
jgi:hypothetical protein